MVEPLTTICKTLGLVPRTGKKNLFSVTSNENSVYMVTSFLMISSFTPYVRQSLVGQRSLKLILLLEMQANQFNIKHSGHWF